jgi:ligand-binding SRPBCC domain-containing protein
MPTIQLETRINAPIEICFDLARSIDLHKISISKSRETAIAGTTTGLINLGESVTWQATHFGVRQKLTSKITAFDRPYHFRDEQVKGAFRFFVHDHYFEIREGIVVMSDVFEFRSPFGFIGSIFDKIVLTNYLTQLLRSRNEVIKAYAETTNWKTVLKG